MFECQLMYESTLVLVNSSNIKKKDTAGDSVLEGCVITAEKISLYW